MIKDWFLLYQSYFCSPRYLQLVQLAIGSLIAVLLIHQFIFVKLISNFGTKEKITRKQKTVVCESNGFINLK